MRHVLSKELTVAIFCFALSCFWIFMSPVAVMAAEGDDKDCDSGYWTYGRSKCSDDDCTTRGRSCIVGSTDYLKGDHCDCLRDI
jgi:hypothetical protein